MLYSIDWFMFLQTFEVKQEEVTGRECEEETAREGKEEVVVMCSVFSFYEDLIC